MAELEPGELVAKLKRVKGKVEEEVRLKREGKEELGVKREVHEALAVNGELKEEVGAKREVKEEVGVKEQRVPRRVCYSPWQLGVLETLYRRSTTMSQGGREVVARHLGLSPETVKNWFKNRRAKAAREIKDPLKDVKNEASPNSALGLMSLLTPKIELSEEKHESSQEKTHLLTHKTEETGVKGYIKTEQP